LIKQSPEPGWLEPALKPKASVKPVLILAFYIQLRLF